MLFAEGKHREEMLNRLVDEMMADVDSPKYAKTFKYLVEAEVQTYSNRELRDRLGIEQ